MTQENKPNQPTGEGKEKTMLYIHKGIEFVKKEQFKLSGEAYRSGVGFGYSCGYQDGIKDAWAMGGSGCHIQENV